MAAATATQPVSPSSGFARWTPSLPTSLIGLFNPFGGDDSASKSHNALNRRSIFDHTTNAGPPSPSGSSAKSIMFAEPDARSASEVESHDGSVDVANKRSSKTLRPKTCYSLCHPPPVSLTRTKLHRRPRSLLQLHRLSSGSRPTPAIDVVPATNLNVRLTRTATKLFKAKHNLCPNDLLVLRAESYSAQEEDDDGQDAHNILGLICKGRKEDNGVGKARISIAHGKEWEASALANGGYEFTTTDEHGLVLTVRWVVKRNKDRDGVVVKSSSSQPKRFNFSTISPNSRRHPVIATLSSTYLEVNDSYKMPAGTAPNSPSATPYQAPSTLVEAMENESTSGPDFDVDFCRTDAELRELISLTSIWVAFKEGWSPTLKYDDKDKDRDALVARSPSFQASPTKAAQTPPTSPALLAVDRQGSIRSISNSLLRKGSLRKTKRASIASSVPSVDEENESASSAPENPASNGRQRADSTSTVILKSVPANRRKSQATWRPDLLITKPSIAEAPIESPTANRPGQTKRASWQAYSSEANAVPTEPATPLYMNGLEGDTKSKAKGVETSSESSVEGERIGHAEREYNMLKPPQSVARKRKSGGGWRKLWCVRDSP